MRVGVAGMRDLRIAATPRSFYSDKRSNGRVLIVGGSARFHGAPVLATNAAHMTLAALRVGAGYAITCVPKSVVSPVRKLSANLIVRPLSGENINRRDLEALKSEAKRSDCVVLGPGLGRERATINAISNLVSYCMKQDKKLLVDADAILAIRGKKLNKKVLITPNDKEFHNLSKAPLMDRNARIEATKKLAQKLDANVLLKGYFTVVSDGKRTKLVETRSAALATMGTGDVLSGIIGGYMTLNRDVFVSAVAGAYLHAKIGDMLYKEKGYHIIASDLVDYIPNVLKKFDKTTY
ncbi:MAG: NAD(P)H-hydrate dehydratase [Candidatus Micrarchaeota archaeon]|nr:NAD(P)H-hydrate dehydratase [Candidatus Micrarchaeota archaeon]